MVLYARSDVASAYVPAESGGCGAPEGHSRPVNGGAPQHPWGLRCPPCENFLRVHLPDQWSATVSEIPETHDEELARKDFEKRGAKDKDAVLTLAIARLAGLEPGMLPESLTRMISGVPMHVPGQMECPQGHAQPAGQKFCGQCGSPMSGPVPKAPLPAPAAPAGKPARPPRLRDQNKATLSKLCASRGLDGSGSNADLVTRLSNAGVTANDLAAFLAGA